MTTTKQRLYNGYEINRGSYYGTSDDRADRWYIEHPDANYVYRAGSGYVYKKDAIEAAKELTHAKDVEPYYN
ncbi:MAG: hypothetical protein ACRKFN_14480 [Desulfitobacterium sp.]